MQKRIPLKRRNAPNGITVIDSGDFGTVQSYRQGSAA
jgi:hypothetical protein